MRPAHRVRLIGAVFAALSSANAMASDPSLDSLVNQLDADSFQKRQQATEAIFAPGSSFSLKQIEQMLTRPELSPEQRVRLCQAGEQLFLREPRGALGVSWDTLNGPRGGRGAIIGGCIENFDAIRVLKPGDAIVGIGAARFEENNFDLSSTISAEILSHDPGDEVTITVLREGRRVSVTCKIGSFAALPRIGGRRGPDAATLTEAWNRRLARIATTRRAEDPPAVLRPPLLQAGWIQARTEAQRGQRETLTNLAQQAKAQGIDPASVDVEAMVPFLVAAGEARGMPEQASREGDPFLELNNGLRTEGFRRPRPDMRRLTDIQSEINRQQIEMQAAMTMLLDPNLGKAQRAAAEQRINSARRRIDELQSQIRQAGVGLRLADE